MFSKLSFIGMAATFVLASFASSPQATPIAFDVAGAPNSSVAANIPSSFCLGCSVTTTMSSGLGAVAFSLSQGQSYTLIFSKSKSPASVPPRSTSTPRWRSICRAVLPLRLTGPAVMSPCWAS